MKQSTTRRLLDARQAAQQIVEMTSSGSFDAVRQDAIRLLGLVKLFEIIGEALNRARKGEPNIEGAVPRLRRYVNLRNQLVHEYDKIDYRLVWQTATEGVPDLLGTLSALTGGSQAPSPVDGQTDQSQQVTPRERRPARQR